MTTPYFRASSMQRVSQEVADFALQTTHPSRDTHDRMIVIQEGTYTVQVGALQIVLPRDDDEDRRPMLWIGEVPAFSYRGIATFLQNVLIRTGSKEVLYFDWMEFNSTQRVSETYGGLAMVTKNTIRFLSTKSLIEDLIKDPTLIDTMTWASRWIEVNPAGNYHPE